MKQPAWKKLLDPYAQAWNDLRIFIEERVATLTEEELRDLQNACDQPTNSNCWFATYNVAPMVAGAAAHELYARRQQAKEATA